jgi:DEAD/DEAH box helicase domain-containing protein
MAGHVVITNPDMLHSGILPHHTKWVRLFEHLRYVVVDELHSYRGVFGSHVANVLRRLQRICRFYGSDPIFVCCSATIANPAEHASALVGRPVELVDDNGAPSGERIIGLYNPPLVNPQLGIRRGVPRSTTQILGRLQAEDVQTIVFAGSRSRVELLTQYARERLSARHARVHADRAVRGYRSGYLPKERRAIEAGLRDGSVRTVVATNALELGIDIGGLDAAVIAGYPGTLASLRQQMGRAGRRRGQALAVLVAGSGALDQYVVAHPEYAFEATVEAALIHPDNPLVAGEHLKCAVFELPLEPNEHALLGAQTGAILEILEEGLLVHRAGERTYWSSEAYPAAEISLRNGAQQNVVIVDQGPPVEVIGEVDRPSAMTLVHDEAIYVHDGRQYHVDRLDWEELKAYVRPVDVDYYTDANLAVDLRVIREEEATPDAAAHAHGDVAVTYLATLFKKIKLHTHENVGWGKIRLPQDDLHTASYWLTVPEAGGDAATPADAESALLGVGQLLRGVAPLLLMSEPSDLELAVQVKSPHTGRPTVFLWESVPGGVGFSERLFDVHPQLLELAREVLEACACLEGCPGCVGPPAVPGRGVKAHTLTLLRSLDAGEAPRSPASAAALAS